MTTPTTVSVRLQLRADTAANWTSANPILLANELGRETDTGKIKIGNGSTAWNSLAYQPFGALITNVDISATAEIAVSKLADGTPRQLLQTDAAGTGVEWASNIDVPGTLDVTGAATFDNNVIIQGDLTVNGTETIINTQTLEVEDKNIIVGKVTTPTDITADGGGITLKGTTDKTINWIDSTDAWTLSEHVNIASAKEYRIAGAKVLDATSLGSAVVSSSLTSVGTIGTGTWQGTAIVDTYLATISTAGKVSNSATTATSSNTASAIVARDGSGNFTAGTITAALTGAASSNVLKAGDTMTGVLAVAAGTAALPGLAVSGDLNTGIYSPGADQLAVATNGTGRITIDGSGNVNIDSNTLYVDATNNRVGIGTSSPDTALHLASTSPVFRFENPTTTSTTGTSMGKIEWETQDASAPGVIGYINVVDSNNFGTAFDMQLATGISGAATTKITIKADGKVGIGTTSPGQQLTVETASGNCYIEAKRASQSTGQVAIALRGGTSGADCILYQNANSNDLRFYVNGNDRAAIDSSGRLLVGTSSYTGNSKFAIVGGSGVDVALLDLRFGGARPTGADSGICEIRFGSPDQTSNNSYAKIECITDGASSSNTDLPARLVFSTTADGASSPTERMRITSGGLVATFSSNGTDSLYANSTEGAGTTYNLFRGGHSATSTVSSTASIRIYTNGNVQNTNGSYTTLSDAKLKENIVDAGSQWDDLKAIQIRNWNFKEETGHETHRQIGPIAQELETVCPGLVFETPDRDEDGNDIGTVTKGVNQSVLYMKAVKALQEAMERIEQLETEMAAVKAQLS